MVTGTNRPLLLRYGVAVLAVGLVLVVLYTAGNPGLGSLVFFAVLVSAWYGGMGPGLFATALILLIALLSPSAEPRPPLLTRVTSLGMFVLGGVVIAVLVEALHAARRRAEESGEEARRHEQTLRKSEEALRESDRHKNEFLATLAHELRNPLAAISAAVGLLDEPGGEAEGSWAREVIARQAGHLARLIDDLLDVSRISRGKIALRKERIELHPLLERVAAGFRALAGDSRHEFAVSVAPEPLWVDADPTRLEQILDNLLTNAAKYTEPPGRIELAARREGEEVVLAVRDTGVGIAPEMLPRVFDIFAQADHSINRAQGGLGLGLTLVRNLAELHDGRVAATSRGLGEGSEFTVWLPASEPAAAKPESAVPSPDQAVDRPLSILIIDDNQDMARALGRLLSRRGHEVVLAADGPTGIELARERSPQAVLVDIGLPGMDGFQVAEQLRAMPGCSCALIIAVSGYGQQEDRDRSKAAGIDHHLVKPVALEELVRLLAEAHKRRAATSP